MLQTPLPHPVRRLLRVGAGAVLAAWLLLVSAGTVAAAGPDDDHQRTLGLLSAYDRAPNWVVKALVLSSLGERWHPVGNRIVLDALRSKDRRLRAFGLEAYRGTAPGNVPVLLTTEVLDELIRSQLKERNQFFRSELKRLLLKAFPTARAEGETLTGWWSSVREGYAPPAWSEAPPKKTAGGDTVARKSVVTRALELSQDGIELVLVFDSTGSMQPTIDAARGAMTPVIEILQGLSPDLRLGLVHYRDRMDLGGRGEEAGAKVKSRLNRNLRKVQKQLDDLRADGGGDIPERVYGGLWLALHRDMGWTLEACKMVVVVGDAPPHAEDVQPSIELAREAYENPVWRLARNHKGEPPVVTGGFYGSGKNKVRVQPITTSTLWTGPEGATAGGRPIHDEWAEGAHHFEEIAKAGGGVFAVLRNRANVRETSALFVTHLVGLTFGVEHQAAATRLAERYIYWEKVGFLK